MLPSFCQDSVDVWRAPYIDSRGTKVRDWAHAVKHTVSGCSFQYRSTEQEWTDARQAVTVRARLYMPFGSDIEVDDRIDYENHSYAVNGAPMAKKSPTGAVSHIVCDLVDWRA